MIAFQTKYTLAIAVVVVTSLWKTSYSAYCPDVCHCSNSVVRCSGEHVTSVPSGLPTDTTDLFISRTSLKSLKAGSFQNLTNLRKLSLTFNHIRQISPGAFEGPRNLSELYLNNNDLQLTNDVYVQGIFRNLSHLQTLYLNYNSDVGGGNNYSYPNNGWEYLPSLQVLKIDGLYRTAFPSGFSKLVNLVKFSTSGLYSYCNLHVLFNSTFAHFEQTKLRYLDISYCQITTVEVLSFKPFAWIDTIDMQGQAVSSPYQSMTNVFYGLEYSPIRTLNMNRVCKTGSHVITADAFKPLQNTNLQTLYLRHNSIITFEKGWTAGLPRSLEHLDLINNYIVHVGCSTSDILNLYSLNLKYLSLSLLIFNAHAINVSFPLPLRLETIIVSSVNFDVGLPSGTIGNHNNLKSIHVRDSTLSEYHGYIKGLDRLENFSVTNINCRNFSKDFFKYMPNLKLVNVSNNYIGDILSNDKRGEYFRHLEALEVLDISRNMIRYLPDAIFMNLKNLTSLRLRNNGLTDVRARVAHMRNLRYLDLAHNSITTFGKQFITDLDIVMEHSNLTIDVSYNDLICSCNTLSFLTWLQKRREHFVSLSSYMCHHEANNASVSMKNLDRLLYNLDAACRDFDVLIPSASVALILLLLIPVAGTIYRYRMHLLYWYYAMKRSTYRQQPNEGDHFKYDAFVSFADENDQFIIRRLMPSCENNYGLKLCIHFRDFIPGTPIAENITNAIHCSRKTVILLDKDFLESDWCMYEFRMAQMEHIYSGRDTMILIVYPCVHNRLTLDIMELMRSQTFLLYPNSDADLDETFWDRLNNAIKGEQV